MEWLLSLDTTLCLLSGVLLIYLTSTVVYNVYFHPLAAFPGPKLAAATRLYELYFDVYLGGQFTQHIAKLHERYGPIVRVNSFELHVNDESFYYNLYNFDPRLNKRKFSMTNLQNSADFETHRMRRRAFDPFFSRASISKLEPLLTHMVNKLCDRLREAREAGTPINLSVWYRCLTCDIILDYALSDTLAMMDDPNKHTAFIRSFTGIFKVLKMVNEYQWIAWIAHNMERLPKWLQMAPSDEGLAYVKLWQDSLEPRMRLIAAGGMKRNGEFPHVVLMDEYWKNSNLPAAEKSHDRLRQTVSMLVGAGLETTGYALSMVTFQLLTHPTVLQRLRSDVAAVWPKDAETPTWATLEKLPYLTAVLKEAMRLSLGVTSRLPRINPQRETQYRGWTIPRGTAISMDVWSIMYNPELFPEPEKFEPERWMQGDETKELNKWFLPFSKGSRACIGEHLAWAEMYITVATVVHRFEMELYQTGREHVYPKYDFFVPFPARENGVQVMVK